MGLVGGSDGKIRIVHLITGLNVGGAETSLCKLVEHIDSEAFDCRVVSMLPEGPLAERIRKLGIPVYSLEMGKNSGFYAALKKMKRLIGEIAPDLIQTWMYHADLLGGVMGKFCGVPVVWNIRHANTDPRVNKKRTLRIVRFCAKFSRFLPVKIVCCAYSAMEVHSAIGYDRSRMLVIPNGFDLATFFRDEGAGLSFRREIGIVDEEKVVGTVARFDPLKGFEYFFGAAEIVAQKNKNVRFVLCGSGLSEDNAELTHMISEPVRLRSVLLGRRSDIPRALSSFDVFVLPSIGEAFPNVVGEAMACEVPCVVTNVGDAARIVGDAGFVVPPGDPDALASGICDALNMGDGNRADLGKAARVRIVENYDIKQTTRMYEELYREVCSLLKLKVRR